MKKSLCVLLAAALGLSAFAQNSLGAADDAGRIILTPVIAKNASIPQNAASAVKNKLTQIATQYGIAGNSAKKRFVITANFTVLTKEVTATTPPMIALELQPTLYIGDLESGALFASCPLPSVKGVGNNEGKAYMSAVKALRLNDPAMESFVNTGKTKIIEYYNSQIDFIISQADALCGQDKFDEAIALLFEVPSVCKEAYAKSMDKTTQIFKKKIDKEGAIHLGAAKQKWNADQSSAGAEEAGKELVQIHPSSSSMEEASKLSEEIAARIKELEQREWDFKIQKYNDQMNLENKALELESQAIEAAKEIGVAQANQPITYNTLVYWW